MLNNETNTSQDIICCITKLISAESQISDTKIDFSKSNFKKSNSYQFQNPLNHISKICECHISCWTSKCVEFMNLNSSNSLNKLEITIDLPSITGDYTSPIIQENGNIIFGVDKDLYICDKNFNVIENFKELNFISVLCNLSEFSFAIGLLGLLDGFIKIYSRNSNTEKYQMKQYSYHSAGVKSLLYFPKQNYLISGSSDTTINVLGLSEVKSIKKLTDHTNPISSLISLNDKTFASASRREIKIWSINSEIECIRTIIAHEQTNFLYNTYLNLLGNDFLISRSHDEIKIWDLLNFNCLKTLKEDSEIKDLILEKNNIITRTSDNRVNAWQISSQANSDCLIF